MSKKFFIDILIKNLETGENQIIHQFVHSQRYVPISRKITGLDLLFNKSIVNNRKPKIGFYAGSFNPFHIGHHNILQKAEKLFDKVIIGVGQNPEKIENKQEDSNYLPKFHEIIFYDGLITETISKLEETYDVTLIRGVRNDEDFRYEMKFIETIKNLKSDIKSIIISSDVEFHFISSSTIRTLSKYNDTWKKFVI